MTFPVAVISFNRPDYLLQTLDSLARQTVAIDPMALFQDGPRQAADAPLIAACVNLFIQRFPSGEVVLSKSNLGPALNIDRAERWIFERADQGAIFEDDMALTPHYVATLQAMLDANRDDERIAYVAAYGPILPEPPSDEPYAPMHVHWAFALTKQQWLKRKPLVDQYLDIIRQRDYRDRDIVAIMALRERWGVPGTYTTQDVMRAAATHLVGGLRLNTRLHMARYIGARGLHIDPRTYDAVGFARWPLHDGVLEFKPVGEPMAQRCRALAERFIGTGSRAA